MFDLKYVFEQLGKRVAVTDIDGTVFRAVLVGVESKYETGEDSDVIELDYGDHYVDIRLDEVKSFVVIE